MLDLNQVQFSELKHDEPAPTTDAMAKLVIHSLIRMSLTDESAPSPELIKEMLKDHLWTHVYGELQGPVCEIVNYAQRGAVSPSEHEQINKVSKALFKLMDWRTQA